MLAIHFENVLSTFRTTNDEAMVVRLNERIVSTRTLNVADHLRNRSSLFGSQTGVIAASYPRLPWCIAFVRYPFVRVGHRPPSEIGAMAFAAG